MTMTTPLHRFILVLFQNDYITRLSSWLTVVYRPVLCYRVCGETEGSCHGVGFRVAVVEVGAGEEGVGTRMC
jgi:hypothetical protein